MNPQERNWNDVLPDVGMLYRGRVRNRAEIDALRHLTNGQSKTPVRFVRLAEHIVPTEPNPEARYIANIDTERLLSRIPSAQHRETVVLHDIEGMGEYEISERLGISRNAIWSRHGAAMKHLRRMVQ